MKKFDDLLVFVAVVEKQSFVAAARHLNLPATTVSRKVQELEARLGVQLLRRTTRRVSPNCASSICSRLFARPIPTSDWNC